MTALALLFGAVAPVAAQPGAPPAGSAAMRQVVSWVIASGDNQQLPFVIVDKGAATAYVFHPDGRLRGASPALLGSALGDDSAPGVGDRKLSDIRPAERTTPAGRFFSSLGLDLAEKELVWVDYGAAVSLHAVVTGNRKERRLERLATASALDNRISYGCINVPAVFFDTVVRPAFTGTSGIVYILPEVRSLGEVFPGYPGGVPPRVP
ncbi:L,D-transpeptidase [Phenylobacterium immobile]|uniref:L,D-transpeptidase n=1 Tax=Phenylobacterium immobile TaxID=21 RepID=UPI001FE0EFD9|nr:L,D-transpeptidase [Phenylobacterium immobile]